MDKFFNKLFGAIGAFYSFHPRRKVVMLLVIEIILGLTITSLIILLTTIFL